MEFGKIIEVPLKEVWAGEATHFTPWLATNLELLSEKLGLELELEGVEASAGDFSADIIAKDVATNRRVIIENQFGGTDHRHLGQILTYSSVLNANVESPRFLRRLNTLRGLSHEEVEQVLTRGP